MHPLSEIGVPAIVSCFIPIPVFESELAKVFPSGDHSFDWDSVANIVASPVVAQGDEFDGLFFPPMCF